jgi:NDP-sugar pyrophosphorylase family protein
VNLSVLAAAHDESGALVTLALVPNQQPLKYGGVKLDDRSHVVGFAACGPAAAGSFHFVGVQVVRAEAFETVSPDRATNTIGGLYDELIAARPGSIGGFVSDATFWDVGTIADYWATSAAFMDESSRHVGRNSRVHPAARVDNSILWDDVEVSAGAMLDECIVADGVVVPAGVRYRRSALVQAEGRLTATPF